MSHVSARQPLVLGFDTSAAHCAAAILRGSEILAAKSEELGRGQAERLFPMLEELLSQTDTSWRDLTAIGVGIGPGNFTGVRISVAAARGLALSLNIPAVGIDNFDATAFDCSAPCLPVLPAPRGQVYLRQAGGAPVIAAEDSVQSYGLPVVSPPTPVKLAENICRLAAVGKGTEPPAPLYIRPANATPSGTPAPVILADGSAQ